MNIQETWKRVELFPYYEVSNLGEVRSERGLLKHRSKTTGGYARVTLYRDRKGTTVSIHSLVLGAFVGVRPNGLQINHKNGQKTDNRARNLEYITCKENHAHAYRNGLHPMPRGERHYRSKISDIQREEIKTKYSRGIPQPVLAKEYGLSQSGICRVMKRQKRKNLKR